MQIGFFSKLNLLFCLLCYSSTQTRMYKMCEGVIFENHRELCFSLIHTKDFFSLKLNI